jgi:ATP-dependent protease ClpP protease subunit
MATLKINGDIIPSDYQDMYDYFEIEGTSPSKVQKAIDALENGEKLTVQINSPGGVVTAGQEIYTMLRALSDVEIQITGIACSAASIIAMAGPCYMSEPAMIMIHNVSSQAAGDYHEMEKTADTLKRINKALANAYEVKTGKSEDEILNMMDEETWLTAKDAIENGFSDGYIEKADDSAMLNAFGTGLSITKEQIEAFRKRECEDKARKETLLNDLYKYGV